MKETAVKPTRTDQSPATVDGWLLAVQLLDTTWRVALPILLLSYIGIRLDRHFGTRPLWSLVGFFMSLPVAILLIYRQLKIAYPDFFESAKKARQNKGSK